MPRRVIMSNTSSNWKKMKNEPTRFLIIRMETTPCLYQETKSIVCEIGNF